MFADRQNRLRKSAEAGVWPRRTPRSAREKAVARAARGAAPPADVRGPGQPPPAPSALSPLADPRPSLRSIMRRRPAPLAPPSASLIYNRHFHFSCNAMYVNVITRVQTHLSLRLTT